MGIKDDSSLPSLSIDRGGNGVSIRGGNWCFKLFLFVCLFVCFVFCYVLVHHRHLSFKSEIIRFLRDQSRFRR